MKYVTREKHRGTFSAMIVAMAVSLIALGGLVFDGGRVVSTYLEISDDAQNAARIGSQQLTSIRAGDPVVDAVVGHREMAKYLQQRGYQSSVYIDGAQITVAINARVQMKVLNLFGIGSRNVKVTRTVQAVSQ